MSITKTPTSLGSDGVEAMPAKKGYNTRSMSAQSKSEMKADKAKAAPPKKTKPKPKRK